MENIIYLVWLHKIWFTHKKFHQIFNKKDNYKEIFENISAKNLEDFWFTQKQIENILKSKENLDLLKIKKILDDRCVKIVTINDNDYPKLLKEIDNLPYFFYLRWKIDNSPKIAIVWSRNITSYWEKIISSIVPDLSKYFSIVSGWAAWCDSFAHEETMKSGWITISVIWTWIDIDYPATNKKMYDKIIQKWWAILSIFPLWEIWNAYNFPIRNEIVRALSNWVLVVEAREKSGSLITAKLALEQGKDLFAVPGDVNKLNSVWCNNLIKNSEAKLIASAWDILEEYNLYFSDSLEKKEKIFETELDKQIYDLLLLEAISIDDISEKLNEEISRISFRISIMELDGFIKKGSDGKFIAF